MTDRPGAQGIPRTGGNGRAHRGQRVDVEGGSDSGDRQKEMRQGRVVDSGKWTGGGVQHFARKNLERLCIKPEEKHSTREDPDGNTVVVVVAAKGIGICR